MIFPRISRFTRKFREFFFNDGATFELLAADVCTVDALPNENQRFCEEKLRFWSFENDFLHRFGRFRNDFDKNRALKTLAQNLKSGSQNPKP